MFRFVPKFPVKIGLLLSLPLVLAWLGLGCASSAPPSEPTAAPAVGTEAQAPSAPTATNSQTQAGPTNTNPVTSLPADSEPAASAGPPPAEAPTSDTNPTRPAAPAGSGETATATALPPDVPKPPPAAAEPTVELPPVGNRVGERVPDFSLRLGDGNLVTSTRLLGAGQPTFLFFFATW